MITATQIAQWAATAKAQRELPRLIRRLTHASATTTQIAMPAGDSISAPGFDGELHSEVGNPWVPKGHSCWELSCEGGSTSKANQDYDTRTVSLPPDQLATRTYVTVTARKWPAKRKWAAEKRQEGKWLDVRAYDADDLEQWLEQTPAVELAFGEELGFTGPGVTSLSAYLSSWSAQCAPEISAAALLVGRDDQKNRILGRCGNPQGSQVPISVRADSVEEAVAFVAAALEQEESLAFRTVVVRDPAGWHFVEKNTKVRIAISARPEIAEAPPSRAGLVLVVPYASGDMANQLKGLAGRLDEPEVSLDRPDYSEFERALIELGVEENDSRRMADLCGRSWSVFRRQHAVNPSIRRPSWLDHFSASALATVCLVGTWSSSKEADKDAVSRIAGRSYEELERDLTELERLDDSPVLHIGTVWKAKSALELLSQFGDRILDAEFDRFFVEAKALLEAADPALELPKSERYAAAIHGKTRPISGFLRGAICDTLIKLAVRGSDMPSLNAKHVGTRVDLLVRGLLRNADEARWLSLADELPALAEASPEEFLAAVEASLERPDTPVRRLLTETDSSSGFEGRCWHAGLLWALEVLGWAPQRLTRVSIILAKLSETSIAGNWVNSPANTLMDFYRSWFPQTGATIEQRIAALDVLIAREAKAAVRLLNAITNTGHDIAHHTARPKWRDDDAGAGYGATGTDRNAMLIAAADRQLRLANQQADQIAALVGKYDALDQNRRNTVIDLLRGLDDQTDEEKEIVRAALRSRIYWHRNYDDAKNVDELLAPLETTYERLLPLDLVIRHAWLFKDHWPDLPVRHREGDYHERQRLIDRTKGQALADLFEKEGWGGVIRLSKAADAPWQVGRAIVAAGIPVDDVLEWIVAHSGELERGKVLTTLAGGMLSSTIQDAGREAIDKILSLAGRLGRSLEWQVRLLVLAPEDRATWSNVDNLGSQAQQLYWRNCLGNAWLHDDPGEKEYFLKELLAAGRPVTALAACHIEYNGIDPELVMEMLDGVVRGIEADAPRLQSYIFQKAVDYIEVSEKIDQTRLAQLEFALIPALGFDGEHHAAALYRLLMSQPEVFVELLCILYKPRHGEAREGTEAEKAAASNAWHVLHACKRQPGSRDDDTITEAGLAEFVREARKLAAARDRLEACDSQLGEIMARAPDGEDGIFPFKPARDILEAVNSEEMLRGFHTGCFNKRGVSSRGVFEGGEQERELAATYRANAKALEITHPSLSAALEKLAKSYDRDGLMEDLEARLRRERR